MADLEKIAVDHSHNIKEIREGCDIVAKYVKANKLILYGGLAIDYALRLFNESIYPDYQIPDYDFYSANNVIDAYNIFILVARAELGATSVLPAYHYGTMRVRLFGINFIADSGYLSKRVYKINKLTALHYKGFLARHPYLQYSDQHRSLAYPFEDTGLLPTILNRWEKDVERFQKLYKYYPVTGPTLAGFLDKIKIKVKDPKFSGSPVKFVDGQVYSGIIAYSIYEYLLTGKPIPAEVDYISVVVEDGEDTVSLPGGLIAERYIIGDTEYIIPDERTGYHTVKINGQDVKIININFLIIHFYTLMLIDYKNKKDSVAMKLYFRCLEMMSAGWEEDKREFFPSLETIGHHKLTKIDKYRNQFGTIPAPESFNYNLGNDINEFIDKIPETYQYNPIYELD
jgi:hypothetical protein